ncbi:phosphoribosylanthranilate isomerase [Aestuariivirga sp.]|uniref:phosphoribosylanthranilate isomerase n=1 Tax=Aestuariivirga sp. TaxID=2650926 RepID=UPI0039E63C6E
MSVAVKICGLSTPETLAAALESGADYVGFVFFPKSPRHVTLEQAAALAAQARGKAKIVALTVDADDALLAAIASTVKPDLIQAHGSETSERIAAIKALTGVGVMKALKVAGPEDIAAAKDYAAVADLLLFDAKAPASLKDALPGGNGLSFDWSLLADGRGGHRFMLSGGLTPENVAEAVRVTGARLVDVSSGVESTPGIKDPERIRKFIEAVKSSG